MSVLTALINVFGRIAVVLIEAQLKMVFALGQALGAAIQAMWQARKPQRSHSSRMPRDHRRPHRPHRKRRR